MTNDRGPGAPSRNINLHQGGATGDSGTLRWCATPQCEITYTTADTCRHCHRETLDGPPRREGR